jgi:hypothetical protein
MGKGEPPSSNLWFYKSPESLSKVEIGRVVAEKMKRFYPEALLLRQTSLA